MSQFTTKKISKLVLFNNIKNTYEKNINLKNRFIIVGDVGNTDVKICILKKIIKLKKK